MFWTCCHAQGCFSCKRSICVAAVKALVVLDVQEMVLGLPTLGPVLKSQVQRDSLLSAYLNMCVDKVWVVRKACADVLPEMSQLAPADMRTTQLLPAFDKLCDDVSHWVQNAALQQLGTFISTLASPIPESEHSIFTCSTHLHCCDVV